MSAEPPPLPDIVERLEEDMNTMAAVPTDSPVMVAWTSYKETEEFTNSKRWVVYPEHADGSLWAAFYKGFYAAAFKASEEITALREKLEEAEKDRDQFSAIAADREGIWRDIARNSESQLSSLKEEVRGVLDSEPTDEMIEVGEEELRSRRQSGMRIYAADIWRVMNTTRSTLLSTITSEGEGG